MVDDYFSLRHRQSGYCVHPNGGSSNPDNTTFAIFNKGCLQDRLKFKLDENNNLKHKTSGKCLHPYNGTPYDGVSLVYHDGCQANPSLQYDFTSQGYLKNRGSGLCIYGSNDYPISGISHLILGPCDDSHPDRLSIDKLYDYDCCFGNITDDDTQQICTNKGLTGSSSSCVQLLQNYCNRGDNYKTDKCKIFMDSNPSVKRNILQGKCASLDSYKTPDCIQFCSNPANKDICDAIVLNNCKAEQYAPEYCACLKPLTSYPTFSNYGKLYDSLTECYAKECTHTNAYKLGTIQCPECLQVMDVGGQNYNANDIQQLCCVSGKLGGSACKSISTSPTPDNSKNTTPTNTNTNTNIDNNTSNSTFLMDTKTKINDLTQGQKIGSIIFIFILIGVILYSIFKDDTDKSKK